MGLSMNPQVECYAGSSFPEHPRTCMWEGRKYTVIDVIQQRRTPEGIGFLVQCTPENAMFDLFFDIEAQKWHILPQGFAHTNSNSNTKPNSQGD